MSDVIKNAAQFVRAHFANIGIEIGSSHAHAVVSHCLGHDSKKSLIDDNNIDSENENLVLHYEPDLKKLEVRISAMKDNSLKKVDVSYLARVIYAGLAPSCECCGNKQLDIVPLGYEEDEPDGWVSESCAAKAEDEYGTCNYCGPSYIYRSSDINRHGECQEHSGESIQSPEEEEDWASYTENVVNNL